MNGTNYEVRMIKAFHSVHRSSNIVRVIKELHSLYRSSNTVRVIKELHSLNRSSNTVRVIKSRRLRWAGHVARMEEGKRAFKILSRKSTGKIPLGRPRRRLEDNIRMDLEEIGTF